MSEKTLDEKKEEVATSKILNKAEQLAFLVQSPGWKVAKRMLLEQLIALDSVSTIVREGKTPEQLMNELTSRTSVVEIMYEWLAEIEGGAIEAGHLAEAFARERKDQIIQQFD
jgi:hypothetical protein